MKKLGIFVAALAITALVGCKNEKKDMDNADAMNDSIQMDSTADQADMAEAKRVTVNMESKSGSQATGEVSFVEENGMVKMEAKFSGLKPGTHAIHLHESADC